MRWGKIDVKEGNKNILFIMQRKKAKDKHVFGMASIYTANL